MARGDLTDAQWERMEPFLPTNDRPGHPWEDHRKVINGILWVQRTGAPWRDLPERYGPWQTCYDRLGRWQRDGTWKRILEAVQAEADADGTLSWECVLDATVVKAHQHAAGAPKRPKGKKGARKQPLSLLEGRPRGRRREGKSLPPPFQRNRMRLSVGAKAG